MECRETLQESVQTSPTFSFKDHKACSPISQEDDGFQPPRYTIDLSLPPQERYRSLARIYKERLQRLPPLFDEVAKDMSISPRVAHNVARLCLRRVHSTEETQELIGISEATDIQLYLLVTFNLLLDLMMWVSTAFLVDNAEELIQRNFLRGCTSGGIRCQDPREEKGFL